MSFVMEKKAAVDIIVTHQDTSSLEDDNMFACLTSDKCRILSVFCLWYFWCPV